MYHPYTGKVYYSDSTTGIVHIPFTPSNLDKKTINAKADERAIILFNKEYCYLAKNSLDLKNEKVEVLTHLLFDGETLVANKSSNQASVLLNVRFLVQGLLYRKQEVQSLIDSKAITEQSEALAVESINLDIQFTKEAGEILNTKFQDLEAWDTTQKVDFYIPPKTKQIKFTIKTEYYSAVHEEIQSKIHTEQINLITRKGDDCFHQVFVKFGYSSENTKGVTDRPNTSNP